LQLWDLSGAVRASKTVSLASGANMHGTISGLFGMKLDTGNVRVLSDRPIYGIGEIQATSGRFITPVPATAY
jgi:hypothetical protein